MTTSVYDIEEIFLHVKQLKEEKNLDLEYNTIQKKTDNDNLIMDIDKNFNNIKPEDIFVILKTRKITIDQFNSKNNQIITKIDHDFGICDICKDEIIFEKNLSGLVIFDKNFICEKCSQNTSNETLNNWVQSKIANFEDVKPIALWLMEKKNKKRLV